MLTEYATEDLKVVNTEYHVEDIGNFRDEPIITIFGRRQDGSLRNVEVTGFHPYFWTTIDAFDEHSDALLNEAHIRHISVPESEYTERAEINSTIQQLSEPVTTLHDEKLVKITTTKPGDVPEIRDWLHEQGNDTFEADVFFTDRFCISTDIYDGVTVPATDDRVTVDELSPCEPPDVSPRILTTDIEVLMDGEFPEPSEASHKVTSISAHDSYTDEHVAWILRSDEWSHDPTWDFGSIHTFDGAFSLECDVRVFDREGEMLADYINYVISVDPDILSGWNSSPNDRGKGFDYPYILNRCKNINEWVYRDLARDDGNVFVTSSGSPIAHGREFIDMMQAYMKTQIHQKDSYSLNYISEEELGTGKDDVENLDDAWRESPNEFLKYNVRDTLLVHYIKEKKNIFSMYDHIRSIAGVSYTEIADANFGIIDVLFLRQAYEKGIALPTSTQPDVQHYWGAYVFEPSGGLHENVTYPDLASLYPNLFKDMNASPETIVGYEDDLIDSQYSKDDCYTVYVDERDENVKDEADDPDRSELYVLKPEIEESFVRDVITDLIDMKYEYKKPEYADEAYGAVKRITNSVYGVVGDSNSYGVGFRLFDWRIAEAITLAGRDVIQYTAETSNNFIQERGYDDTDVIAGDTDSCVLSIPSANGCYEKDMSESEARSYLEEHPDIDLGETPLNTALHESLAVSLKAAEYVDATFDEFMKDRFNITEHNMALEVESYAESAFFMDKKKRYAQWVRWDEGDYCDEVEVKGFELVRSDSAEITKSVQYELLRLLLQSDTPKEDARELLRDTIDRIESGDVPPEEIGIPKSINKELSEYGHYINGTEVRPQPHIRGAKWANQNIEGEHLESGSKPLMYYVSHVRGEYPAAYTADSAEDGDKVDAVSVEDVENLPEAIEIDTDKMAEKLIRGPCEPILQIMGYSWNDMTSAGAQAGLESFM